MLDEHCRPRQNKFLIFLTEKLYNVSIKAGFVYRRYWDDKGVKVLAVNVLLAISDAYSVIKNSFFTLIGLLQPLFPKDVLFFMDKIDNITEQIDSYSLFEKAMEHNLKAYFIMLRSHPDYEKIKNKYPKNIICYSRNIHIKHFFKFVRLSKYFNSFGVSNALLNFVHRNKYIDLIFLDHGIILLKDNIFRIYNKDTANKFLVSNEYEAQIVKEKGGFKDTELIKAALPRFDLLNKQATEKSIFFFFTWRLSFGTYNLQDSIYYKRIMSLLQNKRLIELLKKNNINMKIALHHCLLEKKVEKPLSQNIELIDCSQISKQIKKASMLVTDYSSIWSDFYFQNKPVVFYRLDNGDKNLVKQDKADMEFSSRSNNLLSNITEDENEVIDMIETYIKQDFKVDKEYKNIQNSFFYHKDNIRDRILKEVGVI